MLQREILFRGKSTGDLAPWIYGYYHYDKSVNQHFICNTESLFRHEVIPETVGQFIGMKDKNNTPIYEGDIVQLVDSEGTQIKVVCEYGIARRANDRGKLIDIPSFYFLKSDGTKSFPIVDNYLGKHDLELFEVIGTTHDNIEIESCKEK